MPNWRQHDRLTVAREEGEQLEVFNWCTVTQSHQTRGTGESETYTGEIKAGDGGIGAPDRVTKWLADELHDNFWIDVEDQGIEVVDIESDEVSVL